MAEAVLTLPQELPERSVGWDVLEWCTRWIRQPDGPDAGESWRFTPEQVRFILWWYAVDERGRWLHSRGVLRRAKGWGKSPVVGALALAELCGPVRFAERAKGGERRPWRADPYNTGDPIPKPVSAAWVQLAGVSEKQTTNTMSMVLGMVAESDMVDEYGLDIGLTRIFTAAGGRLEPITASAPTAEGARPTFVVQDETHHWTESNNGTDLDRVNRRNLGKSRDGSARMLETTNAHATGLNSVAEKSFDVWRAMQEGRTKTTSLLYDAREAPADIDINDEAQLLDGLAAAYGDSTWVDLERIRDEVQDLSTPPEDSRRFYLNQITSATNYWIAEPEWAGCAAAEKVIADRDVVTLGFDGSRSRIRGITDATALIGCRVSDGHLFEIGVWEQPPGPAGHGWQVPTTQVDAAVHMAFQRYTVVGFYADPAKWESFIANWEAKYHRQLKVRARQDHPIEWWMGGRRSGAVEQALEQFHSAVVDQDLTHDGSFVLSRHVLNARRDPQRPSHIGKEHPESIRKIDAAVAAVLAWQARLDALAKGIGAQSGFVPRRVR